MAGSGAVPARIAAGVLAALWSLFVLPPQVLEWSGPSGSPRWLRIMDDRLGYDAARRALDDAGLVDHYLVFGVAIVPAMLLAWWAMHPALRALGIPGRVLSILWLVLGPLTALSYLNHDRDAPLRPLWGAEGVLLLGIFAAAIVVAIIAPRDRGIPLWVRILVGATAVLGVGATVLGTYWPHATMIGIGVEAAVLAFWRPGRVRDDEVTPIA